MGLDNYWVIPNPEWSGNPESEIEGDYKYLDCKNPQWVSNELPNICGGMFSGNGANGSFRGKVYATLIQELTDHDIYRRQQPEDVQRIAEGLTCYAMFKDREEILNYDFTEDLFQLIVVFDKYAKAGAALEAWY